MIHETVYALRHIETGMLLRMTKSSNGDGEFCNDCTVRLDHWSGDDEPFDMDTWYIDEAFNAEYVRQFPTSWYNSSERTPQHDYEPDELEIVEIKREIRTSTTPTKIPSFLEYMEIQYSEKEKDHYNYIKGEYEKDVASKFGPRQQWSYTLWDLMQLIEDKKWNPEGDKDGRPTTKPIRKKTR